MGRDNLQDQPARPCNVLQKMIHRNSLLTGCAHLITFLANTYVTLSMSRWLFFAFSAGFSSNSYSQVSAEFVFQRTAPSITILTTDNGRQGSAVAYYDFKNLGTGLLTNCHVLAGAASLQISQGGKASDAVFLYGDPDIDICVIGTTIKLPVVEPRNFLDLRVGETVFALGAPRGLALSITNGIISQLRFEPFVSPMLIQTTTPISAGSSGGGLFDSRGKLIGLTTFFVKDSQALNFAVSINMANGLSERSATIRRLADIPDKRSLDVTK